MGTVIIKNKQDARDYLINQFAPTDSDNRASNALLGAALGGLGGGLLGTAVKKNGLGAGIGAVAGALGGGYAMSKKGANIGKIKTLNMMRGMRSDGLLK